MQDILGLASHKLGSRQTPPVWISDHLSVCHPEVRGGGRRHQRTPLTRGYSHESQAWLQEHSILILENHTHYELGTNFILTNNVFYIISDLLQSGSEMLFACRLEVRHKGLLGWKG